MKVRAAAVIFRAGNFLKHPTISFMDVAVIEQFILSASLIVFIFANPFRAGSAHGFIKFPDCDIAR